MSSSSDLAGAPVLRGSEAMVAVAAPLGADLRGGTWTRTADGSARGDRAVETALAGLAEDARTAARAAGYAAGWAEGRREAEKEAATRAADVEMLRQTERATDRGRVEIALRALAHAATRTDESAADSVRAIQADAVDLAVALAETLVGHELRDGAVAARAALARALSRVDGDERVTVRMHPDDVATLTELEITRPDVTVLADPEIQQGDAMATTAGSVIDASVSTAVARVREVLA